MHDLKTNYVKILEMLRYFGRNYVDEYGNFSFTPRRPRMSDLEILALSVTAEVLEITSELQLFEKIKAEYRRVFPQMIHRTTYSRRRKKLLPKLKLLNEHIAMVLDPLSTHLLVDSMPCPVVKNSRERSFSICKEAFETAPAKGYSAVDKRYFIGYKLHLLTTENGVFRAMQITPGNVHDINFLKGLEAHYINWKKTLIADKGYISEAVQTSLFDSYEIRLKVPPKAKSKNKGEPFTPVMKRKRKRIEVLFSQLTDQFSIKQNYAKTFRGFEARITTKVTAITVLQAFNKANDKPLNKIKYALAA